MRASLLSLPRSSGRFRFGTQSWPARGGSISVAAMKGQVQLSHAPTAKSISEAASDAPNSHRCARPRTVAFNLKSRTAAGTLASASGPSPRAGKFFSSRISRGIAPVKQTVWPYGQRTRCEFLLTRGREMPIVRPPFGKSTDFLEQIPSNFLNFHEVDPAAGSVDVDSDSTTGKCCHHSPAANLRPLRKEVQMKRLSLLLVAFAFLASASGCCCGLCGHGCNTCGYPAYQPSPCGGCGGCGYAPAYPASPGCSTCPTCPNGGCGVQGPVIQQGAFYDGDSMNRAAVSSATPIGGVGGPTLAASDSLPTF